MLGKTVTQYLGFQKIVLALIVLAWLVRLTLSLAGTPNASAKWVSVTAVLLFGVLCYGVAVHTRGFGSYKHLYRARVQRGRRRQKLGTRRGPPRRRGRHLAAGQLGHRLGGTAGDEESG